MRFIIKPDDASISTLFETVQYQSIWKQHSRKVLKAMRQTTGLEFQQRVITARVIQGNESEAGAFRIPMILTAKYRPRDEKLLIMIHELSHRLLLGNTLGLKYLGLPYSCDDNDRDEFIERNHRHLYLFEYDLVYANFGKELAEACVKLESLNVDMPHTRAWNWAMSMSYAERQRALKILAAKAVTRDRWHEIRDKPIIPMDSDAWYRQLNPKVDPKVI